MKITSTKSLKERKFKVLELTGIWKQLIGQPEQNFKMLVYGKEKSGKSTLIIKLADYLSQFGKVLYNSHEEGISKTFQDRLINNDITSDKLFIGHKVSYDDMMSEDFKKRYYKTVIIDSLQYMGLTYQQYKDLTERYKNTAFIFISQINGRGKIKGGTDIAHAVDVKLYLFDGKVKTQGRFTDEKIIHLFDKSPKNQLKIFKA